MFLEFIQRIFINLTIFISLSSVKMCNFYYVNMYNETAAYRNTENEFVIEQNEDSEKHKYENLYGKRPIHHCFNFRFRESC